MTDTRDRGRLNSIPTAVVGKEIAEALNRGEDPTGRTPKPDGMNVPFGHDLAFAAPDEPLILIRQGATLAQRIAAAAHVAQRCAEEMTRTEYAHGVAFMFASRDAIDWRILLERCPKKAANHPPGEWFVPGGRIEPGETPSEACRRECREEMGVDVREIRALPLIEATRIPPGPQGIFIMRPYLVVAYDGELPHATRDGGIPLRWEHIHDMLSSPVPQVRMMAAAATGILY